MRTPTLEERKKLQNVGLPTVSPTYVLRRKRGKLELFLEMMRRPVNKTIWEIDNVI
ncbi:hypothetical protein QUF82_05535 [Thiotrichales bacterium HSG14]|nr:hypothetical protein [Thiotrichales bacterium HSG14]